MIRFYDKRLIEKNSMDIMIASESILFDENIWDNGKAYFKHNLNAYDTTVLQMLSIKDGNGNDICYAYQDNEANRELRMLKEVEENPDALQFQDVFPDIREVFVCGCNELAYYFVKYLEKQRITVKVVGEYWGYFGYENDRIIDWGGTDKLVIYAEEIIPRGFYQTIIRSSSPEFECIDRIYERNVIEEKIQNTIGGFERLLEKLERKKVIILGTNAKAQDAYDLLYEYGIDICCFVERVKPEKEIFFIGKSNDIKGWGGMIGANRTLLGKKVCNINEAIESWENIAFINCTDLNGALGTKDVELFDYYGYERNRSFFLLRDYIEIPDRNLVHILKGKEIKLVGDERLCTMLSEYLEEIEQGDVAIEYVDLFQGALMKETDILCIVYPWYGTGQLEDNPRFWGIQKELLDRDISCTWYFSYTKAFVLIDLYRNRNAKKYSLKQLMPKGILLGKIPSSSGTVFFKGIMDGHPDIMQWKYGGLNDNLFLYCIRMSSEKSENILSAFKKIYDEEYIFQNHDFTDWDKFEKSAGTLLSLKENFTSQELFVIFYMAYMEMMVGEAITDINQKVIYWDPHLVPLEEFSFLARWLEDEEINGQTVFMHRDNMVWMGSYYKLYVNKQATKELEVIDRMSIDEIVEMNDISCQHWKEFHVRFEDIKLHPQKELLRLCDRIGILWSNALLEVTWNGERQEYISSITETVSNFDINPVFNKYEEFFSEFDRFRISLLSCSYQKKYGYTYEDCMNFSRKELQEMFLKEFRFQQKLDFNDEKEKITYYLHVYESLRQQLWKTRKHVILDDIIQLFGEVQIGEKRKKVKENALKKTGDLAEKEKLVKYIKQQTHLILYGIGQDCEALLENLEEKEQEKLIFCDLKAAYGKIVFHGKRLIAPKELCEGYKECPVLITSSRYYKDIRCQLEEMGVSADRIICNTVQLWE